MQSVIGEWIQQGRLEGRQEGRLEGRLEGKQEAKTEMALNLLHKRFGRLNQQSERSIKKLSLDKLDELIFAILDFQSTKDVSVWLRQHTQKKSVK